MTNYASIVHDVAEISTLLSKPKFGVWTQYVALDGYGYCLPGIESHAEVKHVRSVLRMLGYCIRDTKCGFIVTASRCENYDATAYVQIDVDASMCGLAEKTYGDIRSMLPCVDIQLIYRFWRLPYVYPMDTPDDIGCLPMKVPYCI